MVGLLCVLLYIKRAQSKWLYVVPWGLRKLLNWIKKEYNNPPLYITENGFSDKGTLDDQDRIDYYRGYINEVLKGMDANSVLLIISPKSNMV